MFVSAGRINKLFGTDGGVMLSLFEVFPRDFSIKTPLFVKVGGLDVPLWCDSFERRGVSGVVVRFADIDSTRRAQEFLGKEFYLEQAEEDEDEEFYLEDLIGFRVTALGLEGEITDYFDSEANPLFEITADGRTLLIPAVEEFIVHIDFKGRTIKLVLPEGLLTLE